MNRLELALLFGAIAAALPVIAAAQGVPAAGQEAPRTTDQPPPPSKTDGGPERRDAPVGPEFPVHPWKLPAIDVPGEARPELVEEDRVGEYGQPRWTSVRRFPTTRLYVLPAGKAEAEYWLRYTAPLDAFTAQRQVRSYYELGFGLGHRLQLDIYVVSEQEGTGEHSSIQIKREQLEVRYALADWGVLWGNPTFYLEWQRRNGENDWLEPKLLIGGQLAPGWHAGLNFVLEKELGGDKLEQEYNVTAGISRTVVDQVFHVGLEGYVETHDFKGKRFAFTDTERLFLAGPSVLWHPVAPMHLLFSPLLGLGSPGGEASRPMMRLWLVSGWTF